MMLAEASHSMLSAAVCSESHSAHQKVCLIALKMDISTLAIKGAQPLGRLMGPVMMLISNTMIEIPLHPDQKKKKILTNASWGRSDGFWLELEL